MTFATPTKEELEDAPAEAFAVCRLSPELKAVVDDDVKKLEDRFVHVFGVLSKYRDGKGQVGSYLRTMAKQYEREMTKAQHKLTWLKLSAYQKDDAQFKAANPGWEAAVQSYDDAFDFTLSVFGMAKNFEGMV